MSAASAKNVFPLAFPKGVKFTCELCQRPAHKCCDKCRVTFYWYRNNEIENILNKLVDFSIYSDKDHQEVDWLGIHEKICQSMIPLRTPATFLPSEEQRKKRDAQLNEKKVSILKQDHPQVYSLFI